jgi:nucleoside-diphosphate-sugar epimerase
MNKTALVTGVNGFIGGHLVEHLQAGDWKVAGVVHRNRARAERILASDQLYGAPQTTAEAVDLLNRVQPEAIFHLASATASETPADIDQLLATNINLGAALLEASTRRTVKPRFIMAGSFWEFSDGATYTPNTLYAATKHCLHDLLVYYRERHELHAVSLVLFDTYGPDDPRNKLWNQLTRAEAGSAFDLTAGEQLVELVHVRDVVSAFTRAAELLSDSQLAESAYAVRSAARGSLRSIVEAIRKLTGKDIHLDWGARQYRSTEIFAPWSGPLLPGWTPHVTLQEGIGELLRPHS